MSALGLICGIIGLAGGVICPFAFPLIGWGEIIFVIIAIIGIILSAIGRKKRSGRGAGTAGLVLSIIAVVLGLIFTFACTVGKKAADTVTDIVTDELQTVDEQQVEDILNELADQLSAEVETQAEEATEAEAEAEVVTAAPAENTDGAGTVSAGTVIEYGDVAAIEELAKNAQNFAVDEGTTVTIDGVFSTGISTPSINEPDGEGGYKGLNLYVDGDWEAPAGKTDIEVTGTFTKGSYFMEFHADPANITIK